MQQSDDPNRKAVALTCYCDDSGSHEESEVVVVGAVVMKREAFVDFCKEWDRILREFRIDKVHMADFVRPYGRYCTMASEMKHALCISVGYAISQFKAYSISAAVSQAGYKDLLSTEIYRKFMGPYALAFTLVASVNISVGKGTGRVHSIAYLIDKGNKNHHEQLEGAHTAMLHIEKGQNESFTGPMTADLDDNNYALQAADVIAWTYHRKLESEDFGEDFSPLLLLLEEQLRLAPDRIKLHFPVRVPPEGVEFFANLLNSWIESEGRLPKWREIMESARSAGTIE
jgi:hypothetical protein